LKVTYIYRPLRAGGFSIEEVFSNVRKHIAEPVLQSEWRVNSRKGLLANIRDVAQIHSDIFHITGDCNYLAMGMPASKTLLTVHDVGHYEITLNGWRRQLYKTLWWKLPLRKVGTITAISTFTKDRLVKLFGIESAKIQVIHDPAPIGYGKSDKDFNSHKPRILQIGSSANKNVCRLVEAVKGLPCRLVLVNDLNADLKQQLKLNNIEFEQKINLTRAEIIKEYQRADIVYFASTYEGFGLPIVEAQTVGRAIITSNICSMPEVAGEGALLVDPFDTGAIRDAIKKMMSSKSLVDDLREKGYENVKRFDPALIANQYLERYKAMLT
jgi:glycosyltransferase involved in cell wall biosynthesis